MQNNQTGQVLDVFSTAEIQALDVALGKLKNSSNRGQTFFAYTNGFETKDLIYPLIKKTVLDKVQKTLGQELKLTHGMHLKEQTPWPIHTDYVKGDQRPGLAILIPLNIETIPTHTVVFNECCTDSFEIYMTTHDKVSPNSIDLHKDLMSHESVERLEYVSVNGIYQWHPGSIIYWDRKLLHTSDNFLISGLTEKTALVLFFNND
jgi:hypothetical protein